MAEDFATLSAVHALTEWAYDAQRRYLSTWTHVSTSGLTCSAHLAAALIVGLEKQIVDESLVTREALPTDDPRK